MHATGQHEPGPPAVSASHARSVGLGLVAALLVAAVLALGAGGSDEPAAAASSTSTQRATTTKAAPTPRTITVGSLALSSGSSLGGDVDDCFGTGGYGDIAQGAQVKVTDAGGSVIAIGALGRGSADRIIATRDASTARDFFSRCNFPVRVDDYSTPTTGIYGVEVANRGVVNFTAAQLQRGVQLTLG